MQQDQKPWQIDIGLGEFHYRFKTNQDADRVPDERRMKGIVRLENQREEGRKDRMVLCFAKPGQPRPSKLQVSPASGLTLVQLERFFTGESEITDYLKQNQVWYRDDGDLGYVDKVGLNVIGQTKATLQERLEAIRGLKQLSVLTIAATDSQERLPGNVARLIAGHKHLTQLDLLVEVSSESLKYILEGSPNLTTLTLVGQAHLSTLASLKLNKLEVLKLSRIAIGDNEARAIAQIGSLRSVSAWKCDVSESAKAIVLQSGKRFLVQ